MLDTAESGASVIESGRTSLPQAVNEAHSMELNARHAAFTALVEDHDERLRTLTYQLLGDRQAMDDVLQDVYVKAYRSLPSFRGEASLSTWLYRITYTTCLDRLRRSRRPEQLPVEAAEERPAETTETGERLALGEELRRALSGLDAEHRAAVLLVLRDGHSYDAAAQILGVPRGTVASRVARARRHLAHSLSATQEGRQR